MSNRLEMLRARMRAEEAAAAAKPVKQVKPRAVKPTTAKPKAAKPKAKPEKPTPVVFDPKPSLLECISTFTPEEAANPKVVAGTITLFAIEQIMRSERWIAILSDNMSENLAWLAAAPFAEKVDLKRVFSTAMMLTDAIEFRGGSFQEGEIVRRLHQIEKKLIEQQMKGGAH